MARVGIEPSINREIERLIDRDYTPRPAWCDPRAAREARDLGVLGEHHRLTIVCGLTPERARLILARLINRSPKTVEGIIYPAKAID